MTTATLSSIAPAPADGSRAVRATVVIATIARVTGETGVQTHSRTLRDGLAGAGFTCMLQTPFGGNPAWLPVFAVRPLALSRLNKTWSTRWHRHWHAVALRENLLRFLQGQSNVTVVAQCPVSAQAALEARARLKGRFPIAMVCHFNYSEATEYRDKGELNRKAFDRMLGDEKQILQSVDQVIYVSHWARRIVEEERGIHPRASAVIWNGICPEFPATRLTRAGLGWAPDDLVLVNIGTLEPRKNQLALLGMFAQIADDFPNARLVLIGDGPMRAGIQRHVARLGLGAKVRLPGFRPDVADILSLSDIYVHAALLENCPISIIEAARAGLPVAAAPAGGVPELLEAIGGTHLAPNDPVSSARALWPLLKNAELRRDMGRLARRSFEQHFTREAMVARYVRALRLSDAPGEA